MAKKLCIDCGKRRVIGGLRGNPESNLCAPCYDYALEENRHSDEGHEVQGNADDNCIVCIGLSEWPDGHSNGIPKSHTSHAGCDHPSTKSARAACRRRRAK